MISRTATLAALLSTSLLAASAAAQAPAWEPVVTPASELTPAEAAKIPAVAQQSAHERLFQLFKQSDEESLKRNPISGLFRGDLRYADQFGDYITDESDAKEKAPTAW